MIKILKIFLALLTLSVPLQAQERFFTRTGHIDFYSHTPVEDIKADNDQVTSFLDVATGEIVFAVLIRSFQFEKPLMQEHFNENYLESEKYPKATFEGKLTDPKSVDFSKSGKYAVRVKGKLTIHGVTREVEAGGTLVVDGEKIAAESGFDIRPEDYQIKIPSVVRKNIAETVKIAVRMNYQKMKPQK